MATQQNKSDDSGLSLLAIPLAWLVPGAGHMLIGQRTRGIVFCITIHLMFAAGLLISGIRAINPPDQAIWTYTQFMAGWPTLVAWRIEKNSALEMNDLQKRYLQDYPGRDSDVRTLSDSNDENARQEARQRLIEHSHAFITQNPNFSYVPKVQDVGSVYCGIAGMLNLLVFFDVLLRLFGPPRHAPKDDAAPAAENTAGGVK